MIPKWSVRDPEWIKGLKKLLLSEDSFKADMSISKFKCPTCGSDLYISELYGTLDLICLNTCHLPKELRDKYHELINQVEKKNES